MKDYYKHVLFVGPHYSLRGGMASVLEVYSKNITDFNFLSTYVKKNPILSILYFALAMAKFIWILISKRQIKIIHIHSACRGSFIRKSVVLLLSKLFGKTTLLHIHGGEFKVYYEGSGALKPYILYILNAADELMVLSDEWKTYFDSITKKHKAIVVNNPVIMPEKVNRNTVQIPVRILYLNHVTVKKGIFDIVELFKKNKSAYKGVFKLSIAGTGNELEKLTTEIAENGLEELIDYKGWVSGKQKDDLIQDCNLFILTSYYEGLPMSILESMAFGKPVISSNVGGIPQIVKPRMNGWLVKPGDVDALENIFSEIKAATAVLETYGNKSLDIVKDFSATKVIEKLNGVYAGLLDSNNIKQQPAVFEKAE
ncbi:MAG: glycosyltransferase family 4 protein [Chitinophagaceae bacterium]|nr:glycosyltransferase family 4 protein [Chitinophagaceae bacterium]